MLWRSPVPGSRLFGVWDLWQKWPPRLYFKALAAIVFVVALVGVGWDYYRVSQVFKPVEQRLPSLRQGTLDKVSDTWLFSDAVDFARLTTMPVNQDTAERVLPYYDSQIKPYVLKGETILIAAHGNSLRALVMQLEQLTREQVLELNIPTGAPLLYELDNNGKVLSHRYL